MKADGLVTVLREACLNGKPVESTENFTFHLFMYLKFKCIDILFQIL